MDKVKLGNTGIEVSKIGFGVLPMGGSQMNLTVEEGARVISHALSKGINFFDTAQYYDTYKYMAPAFKDLAEKPVISSKCLYSSYDEMMNAIDEALSALSLDVIDIFLLHEVRSIADYEARSGAVSALLDAKKAGKIRAAGLSTHHQDVCMFASSLDEMDVVFPLINKDGLGIRSGEGFGSAEGMAKAIESCSHAGKGLYAMKVLGGGNLSGSYVECMNYVYNLPGVSSLVLGFTDNDQVDAAVSYAEGKLPEDYKPDISMKRMYINQEDCEGCGSCMERCPAKAISRNKNGLCEIDHDICLTCGYCAPVCPVRALIMY